MRTTDRILLLLLLLILAASIVAVNDALLYTPDSARYLIWAQSLARFDGFDDFTLPDPTRYVVHAPFYPILLAPAAFIAPGSVVAAKLTNALLAFMAVWLFYRWLSRAVGTTIAAWTAALLAVNGLTLIYGTQVLSEIPFAIAVIAAVMLAEDLEDLHSGHTAADMAGIILALSAAMFLREVGVTVVAAFVVLWLLRKQWRAAAWVGGLCLLLYALWFLRNEVIVAGMEQPPLRNSRLLVAHLYTPQSESLFAELIARLATNARTYAGHLSTLVFAPDLTRQSHGLVSLGHGPVQWALIGMPILAPFFLAVTLLASGAGAVWGWSRVPSVRRVAVILGLYAVPVLLYPINDIRFLYPVLLGLLYLGAVGVAEAGRRWGARMDVRILRWIAIPCVVLSFGPHLVWAGSYFVNNGRLAHDRERLLAEDATPEYYRKTLADAGRWLREHVEPGVTILSRWKEVALEAGDRKVLDVDPQMTPDNFDRTLRDYNVRYVVSVVWQTGLRENETQIEYSSRYAFVPVHRTGTVEILRVEPKEPGSAGVAPADAMKDSVLAYRAALRLLRRGDPVAAESLFVSVERKMTRYTSIVYQQAVAKALAGRLDDAMALFERFRSVPQAGSLLQQAWYHQEIISRLRAAHALPPGDERATRYHIVAVNYWELGYREQSFRMLDSALAWDRKFFPALIFGAVFRFQDGSPERAVEFLRRAEDVQAVNPLVQVMKEVLAADDAMRSTKTAEDRAALYRRQAQAFASVDMREDAIDAWRAVLHEVPEQHQALRALSGLMSDKRRYAPAREYARRWVASAPGDQQAQQTLVELENRWQ